MPLCRQWWNWSRRFRLIFSTFCFKSVEKLTEKIPDTKIWARIYILTISMPLCQQWWSWSRRLRLIFFNFSFSVSRKAHRKDRWPGWESQQPGQTKDTDHSFHLLHQRTQQEKQCGESWEGYHGEPAEGSVWWWSPSGNYFFIGWKSHRVMNSLPFFFSEW